MLDSGGYYFTEHNGETPVSITGSSAVTNDWGFPAVRARTLSRRWSMMSIAGRVNAFWLTGIHKEAGEMQKKGRAPI